MSELKITFLGTATSIGVPIIGCDCKVCTSVDAKDKRLRSSVLLEIEGKSIVIDCGPDFRTQMLRANVKSLDAILLTHEHRDHIAGLDDVRAFNLMTKRSVPMYSSQRVYDAVCNDFSYIFSEDKYKGAPEIESSIITNNTFNVGPVSIEPIEVLHYKLPVFGFRVNDFVYITDASSIPEIEMEKLEGAKVLVINALRMKKHFSHFSLDEALEIIDRVKPDKAYLTHISHMLGTYDEVSELLPENVYLAYDNLVVDC